MLRNRDVLALIMALLLSRMAWVDRTESLSASANLAFSFDETNDGLDTDGR